MILALVVPKVLVSVHFGLSYSTLILGESLAAYIESPLPRAISYGYAKTIIATTILVYPPSKRVSAQVINAPQGTVHSW
jgi:hypothetical protein